MATKKSDTSVDEAGLRLFCPDGHRIYWTRADAAERARRMQEDAGRRNAWWSENYGICSDGMWFKQYNTPTKRESAWDRNSKVIAAAAPRLAQQNVSGISGTGGKGEFIIRVDHRGKRIVTAELTCGGLNVWLIEKPDGSPGHDQIDTRAVHDEATWESARQLALQRGWDLTQWILCPTCQSEQDRWNKYLEKVRNRALALEETPVL